MVKENISSIIIIGHGNSYQLNVGPSLIAVRNWRMIRTVFLIRYTTAGTTLITKHGMSHFNVRQHPIPHILIMALSNCSNAPENKVEDIGFLNPLEESERMTFLAFYCAVSAVSAMANVWSLAVLPARAYQIPYKFCLASLSISDFLYGMLVSMDNAVRLKADTLAWVLDDSLCSLIPFLTTACVLNSSLTIACVAIERYLALSCVREKFQAGLLASITLTLLIWAVSLGIAVPLYLDYTPLKFCVVTVTPTTLVCSACATVCYNNRDVVWYSVIYGAIFVPIVLIFLFAYTQIALYALRTRYRGKRPAPSTTDTTGSSPVTSPTELKEVPRKGYSKKKLRTFRVVLVIIVTFIIGRLPQFTLNLVTILVSIGGHDIFVWRYVFSILGVANTALNPFLYSLLDDVLNIKRRLGYKAEDCLQWVGEIFERKSRKGIYTIGE